jgi:hypothetical protein
MLKFLNGITENIDIIFCGIICISSIKSVFVHRLRMVLDITKGTVTEIKKIMASTNGSIIVAQGNWIILLVYSGFLKRLLVHCLF